LIGQSFLGALLMAGSPRAGVPPRRVIWLLRRARRLTMQA
jgi:hypothetical protein